MAFPIDQYGLVRRAAALDAAISDNELAAAVRRRELIRLVPGVFVPASTQFVGHEGAQRLHRFKAIAVATNCDAGAQAMPLSHASAAAVHGLPLLKPDIESVHVVNGKKSGGFIQGHRHVHAAPFGDDDIVEVDGMLVTTLERTAVDVATSGTFAQSLAAFDQALRTGANAEKLAHTLADRRRRGVRTARRALRLADPLSENVAESWSRAQMIEAGLPIPRLQHEFRGRRGTYYSDFDWDERLIGEFDGMVKYGRLRKPGTTVEDAVMREKRREDDLRALGAIVVRWTWTDLEKGAVVGMLRPWLESLKLLSSRTIPA
ncbi:hypothetical protein [Gordonia alkanivorans]|uniref:hypothetical protein n=1 Tax=Gordonia alkanivorans TaxID=84096 RepID=UPI00244BF7C9|nr:hypothetical protein [Gordonia alkanivorans]MDH3012881.1 hypothetical protein [Gordonia alkanivorans]